MQLIIINSDTLIVMYMYSIVYIQINGGHLQMLDLGRRDRLVLVLPGSTRCFLPPWQLESTKRLFKVCGNKGMLGTGEE